MKWPAFQSEFGQARVRTDFAFTVSLWIVVETINITGWHESHLPSDAMRSEMGAPQNWKMGYIKANNGG